MIIHDLSKIISPHCKWNKQPFRWLYMKIRALRHGKMRQTLLMPWFNSIDIWTLRSQRLIWFKLVFPRDRTSRETSRDKPGRDVLLSLCPGTKKILVRVSLCPGTRAGANVPGQNEIFFFQKRDQSSCFRTSFSALPVLSSIPSQIQAVLSRPRLQLFRPILSLGKISSLSHCPFAPGQ